MPAGDHVQPVEALEAQVARLEKRLGRERAARAEAESISERTTRELYDKQQGLILIEAIAKAANEATGIEASMAIGLEAICSHRSWRLGHLWLRDDEDVMVSTGVWVGETDRYAALCGASVGLVHAAGNGLPGRVLAESAAVWISDAAEIAKLRRGAAMKAAGLHTALCFPIFAGKEVVGVLEFFTDRLLEPDEELLALMAHVGTQLGRVVERQRAAKTLEHQATHDALTGLPNRVLIIDQLRRSIARRARHGGDERVAVFFIDLDGFKAVNDTLGHAAGDRLLGEVAHRLATVIRPQDTLGRLSGDEFIVVCDELSAELSVVDIAERLGAVLRTPFDVDGERFLVTASIGIAMAEDAEEPSVLIAQADAAMYRSKELGRARFEVFSEELRERIAVRLETERALRQAVARGELCLHYQPEVDLRTGAIVGLEALVRWQRPAALLLPGDFIRLAEDTGLIIPLGAWVLNEALCQLGNWRADEQIAALPWMSVNLSVRQLADPELMSSVVEALSTHGADPAKLFLEVTESVLLDDAEAGLTVLTELRSLGTEIAIDDFGTGYASLSYLRRFPASVVKVDRSFIADIDKDERTRSIVASIVAMGRALDLSVVAEGIETAGELAAVRELGFDIGQGFFFARPAPADDIGELLRSERPFAAEL